MLTIHALTAELVTALPITPHNTRVNVAIGSLEKTVKFESFHVTVSLVLMEGLAQMMT